MRFTQAPSPVPGIWIWHAKISDYSFVISFETDTRVEPECIGYSASWKNIRIFGQQPANKIDGGPWKTFSEAEHACEETLKQLEGQAMALKRRGL